DPHATPALQSLTLRYATGNQAPEVTRVEVPDLDAVNLESPKKLRIKWTATDANEDTLTYRLYAKKDGWNAWVLLEDELEKTEFEWDTTTTPSGVYRVKVVASDAPDNPPGEALTGEKISASFVVCHAPPSVSVRATPGPNGKATIEATAESPLVRLTGATYALNGRKWRNGFPEDGLFDGKHETFRFAVTAGRAGTYVLVLKVTDAAGNTGSGDVVFRVK